MRKGFEFFIPGMTAHNELLHLARAQTNSSQLADLATAERSSSPVAA